MPVAFAMSPPLLDGCILAVLSQQDAYGYALAQRLKGLLDVPESTLYPALRRLQKEGCLTVYDQPYQGRNRRYYAITSAGEERLEQARRDWTEFRADVEVLLMQKEEGSHEQQS